MDSVEVRATDLIHKLYTRAVTSLRAPVTLMLGTSILHSKSTVAACNLHDRDWVNVVRDSRARIYSTPYAFAALSVNGSVATWGCPDSGGDSSAVAYLLTSRVRTVAQCLRTRRIQRTHSHLTAPSVTGALPLAAAFATQRISARLRRLGRFLAVVATRAHPQWILRRSCN